VLFFGLFVLGLFIGLGVGSIPFSSADSALQPLAPGSWIQKEDILVYSHEVKITLQNARWAEIADTHSMLPLLNGATHVLQLEPESEVQLQPGDVVSYRLENQENLIIHRIIAIGEDEFGWFAITKGDNNQIPDREKVRFSQIEKVLVGILY
jgi:signal peptidase I